MNLKKSLNSLTKAIPEAMLKAKATIAIQFDWKNISYINQTKQVINPHKIADLWNKINLLKPLYELAILTNGLFLQVNKIDIEVKVKPVKIE